MGYSPHLVLAIIIALIAIDLIVEFVVESLNLAHLQSEIPTEFVGYYDGDRYRLSQRYLRERTRLGLIRSAVVAPLTIAFIALGGLGLIDRFARDFNLSMIGTGLVFTGVLGLLAQIVNFPFSLYGTFVVEERYGFNKTTVKTYLGDLAKGWVLSIALGGALLALILWFFSRAGSGSWIILWLALTAVQMLLLYLAPALLMPLFNTFTPLDDGPLKTAIESYATSQRFSMAGIFTMDGSRRSTKSNAFFTGFGRWRRIVLFDTLIAKHSVDELVAILAHEIGHYRLRHIHKQLVMAIASTGGMLFILSFFVRRPELYTALSLAISTIQGEWPVYGGLIAFGFLYSPVSTLLSIYQHYASRRHEFEADRFAVTTRREKEAMVAALKKLSVDNLSDLTPHPWKVFLEYSHPPVLERISAIRAIILHK